MWYENKARGKVEGLWTRHLIMRPKEQSQGIVPKRRDKIMIGFGKTAVVFLLLAVVKVGGMFLILDTCPELHMRQCTFLVEGSGLSRSLVFMLRTTKNKQFNLW